MNGLIDWGSVSYAFTVGMVATFNPCGFAMLPAYLSFFLGLDDDTEDASGGVLRVSGTIDPGSAERFAAEIARVGEYVKRIELNSPGGSVRDALAISRAIRERELDTAVADGALCASSCPLILAGGKARHASSAAAIGVHQVFIPQGELRNADNEVSGTQALTAEITRHLEAMGVDPALWLHALETPPSQLYYLTPEELQTYRLATAVDGEPAA